MGNFQEKEMYLYNKITAKESFGQFVEQIPPDFDGFVFYSIRKDSIGQSSANPTWGDFYRYHNHELYYDDVCIYKEMDYDSPDAPYAEKLWSLLGKRVLTHCRVPDIDLVKDKKYRETGTISHIILDHNTEDMIDMKTLLFYKFERQDLNQNKSIVKLNDLLECVRMQVSDDKNYQQVESSIVQALLLDSLTNNADRHANNWALIRNKQTNHYCVGLFDHSASFLDMMKAKHGVTINGWTSTYTKVQNTPIRNGLGDLGNIVTSYLFSNYPEACKEFVQIFDKEIEGFYQDISSAPSTVDQKRIRKAFTEKRRLIETFYERNEIER